MNNILVSRGGDHRCTQKLKSVLLKISDSVLVFFPFLIIFFIVVVAQVHGSVFFFTFSSIVVSSFFLHVSPHMSRAKFF